MENDFKETLVGNIPCDWDIKSVKELINEGILDKPLDGNHGGIHPKQSDFVESGIPFIMASDIKNGIVDYLHCKYISEEQAKSLKKGFAKEKDVLLTHKATIGQTAIVKKLNTEYIILTPQVTYYRVKNYNKLNNLYLMYYFKFNKFKELFCNWAGGGSTRAYLGITAQQKLPIILPPISEQQKVASILSSLDDKIELNNEMNKTLEEMAQAIFKSWFVDFEPFKDREFEESELGMIPKGWKVDNINSIVDATDYVANGSFAALRQNVAYSEGEGYAVLIRLVDYNKGFNEPFKYVDKKGYEFLKKSKLFGGEIIISNVGANAGTVFKSPKLDVPMTLGPNSIMLIPNNYSNYLYLFLTSRDGQEKLKSILSGSAQPKFNKTDFRNIKIVIPPIKIIESFNKIINSFMDKFEVIWIETRQLEQIRDTLLPKLISGEIKL